MAGEMVTMYRSLAGKQGFTEILAKQNIIGCRLRLLSAIANGAIGPDTFSFDEARGFHEALLDAIALQYATGDERSVFAPPKTGDPSRLGRSRDRLAKLKGDIDSQLDWHFQLLIQGWGFARGLGPLKDLRDDARFTGRRVCDFEVPLDDGSVELLECKRVHVHRLMPTPADGIAAVITKIRDRLPQAADQLDQTAVVIGNRVASRHLLIDVSAYSEETRDVPSQFARIKVIGFRKDDADQILNAISASIAEGNVAINKVTLCWRTLVLIENKIRAIVQNPVTAPGPIPARSSFNYEGWTVEGYPMSNGEYREFRVSKTVRSLDWIVTCYNNLSSPGTFCTVGPEEGFPTE